MYSPNVRVVIQDEELNRIRDYVASVPHRATGGLLLGNRYVRNDVELVVITRSTTRVPDERLPDERCANHPLFTRSDLGRALETKVDAEFLGRWHAHLDGMTRPSGSDLDWARAFLQDADSGVMSILHPIVVYNSGEIGFHPFMATRESGTFQKIPWESATADEIERIRLDRPAPVTREQQVELGIFSLQKTLQLFREEAIRVASLPDVTHTDVRDDGSCAILEVEMNLGSSVAVLHISADPTYPLNPPALRVQLDGRARKVTSQVLTDWTSMCNLRDVVKEVSDALVTAEHGEALPPPEITESDPVKREVAMLQSARYRVYKTPVDQAGTLITVRSALLDDAGKVYYAILPPGYPNGKVAWAIADEGKPLSEVSFDTLEERPPDFTLLTWFERLVPAAREERARAAVALKRRPLSMLVMLAYLLLFALSAVAGYAYQTCDAREIAALWVRVTGHPLPAAVGDAPVQAAPTPSPVHIALKEDRPVLAIVFDAGQGTNLNASDTQWAVGSALRPTPVSVMLADLRNATGDLDRALRSARGAQAIIVFTYAAGDRQSDFVASLARGVKAPVGVVSMSPGSSESKLMVSAAFYQTASGSGRGAAQRALLELVRVGTLKR